MRVAFITEFIDVAGGIERGLTVRANYLVENFNFQVVIFCTNKTTGKPFYQLNKCVEVVFLDKLSTTKSFLGRIFMQYEQSKEINKYKPDVIISVKFTLHNFFLQALKKRNQKLVSELREPKEQYENNTSIKAKIYNKFRSFILKKQDLLITLTNRDKQQWGFSNMAVVNNARMLETNIVSNLDFKQVLSVCRLHKVKGVNYLIKAWSIVHKKHPDWKLKICGEGEEYERLKKLIIDLELVEAIILNNESVDVTPEFLSSSIFVLTSKFEAFGNVLVEALTFGLPIVSFDTPSGPREIISNNVDGFIVPLFDIEALADKICLLIGNTPLRKKMGNNAVVNSKRFDLDEIMRKYKSLIL